EKDVLQSDIVSFDHVIHIVAKVGALDDVRRALFSDVGLQAGPRILLNALAHSLRVVAGVQFEVGKQLHQKRGPCSPSARDYHMPAWSSHGRNSLRTSRSLGNPVS